MIRKITVENYKSFRDKTEFTIKPITIFVGPNSAGKSNILKLFGLVSQSYKQRKSILSLSGHCVDVGNFDSLSYNLNQNIVQIGFELQTYAKYSIDGGVITDPFDDFCGKQKDSISQLRITKKQSDFEAYYKGISSIEEFSKIDKSNKTRELEFRYNQKYLSIIDFYKDNVLKKLNPILKDLELIFSEAKKLNISLEQKTFGDFFNIAIQDFLAIPLNKGGIDFELGEIFDYTQRYQPYYWGRLDFESMEFQDINRIKLFKHSFNFNTVDSEIALKDLFHKLSQSDYKDYYEYLIKITIDELYFLIRDITKEWVNFTRNEIISYYVTVRHAFDNIDYFSSLRSNPKRYYTREEFENEVLAGKSIDIIDDELFQNQLNKYLLMVDINYRIEIDKIQSKKNIPILYTINLIDIQNNQSCNYPDVGFGLSQTIPFLITLSTYRKQYDESTFVIHQPELHLHPNSTAKLSEVFLRATKKGRNKIIMETHSEHLIRGFQVLVAQGKLKPEDIAIYYIDKKDGVSSVEELPIDEKGFFTKDWPEGFMDVSYNLGMDLLKAQKK